MKSSVRELETAFYCGRYLEVIEDLGRAPLWKNRGAAPAHWPLQVGALVFTGEVLEASAIFEAAELSATQFAPTELMQARFFVGIGLVRLSRYREARTLFARNLAEAAALPKRSKEAAKARFFAQQGAAFMAFFRSSFRVSGARSSRAYAAAVAADFPYGQALAAELIGHVHCQLGDVHRGLADLRKAQERVRELGNGRLEEAFQISFEVFRAQFGHDAPTVLRRLNRALETLAPQDTHSRAELCLELARQLTLRGKASQAKALMDRHCDLVYQHQNRRQSAIYNLRYAHLFFLRGEAQGALTLLRSSRGNLVPSVDKLYLAQLEGLERKILGQSPIPSRLRSVNFVDERIVRRGLGRPTRLAPSGEDPLGDLLDAVAEGRPALVSELLRSGYWGLLPAALGQDPATSFVYLGPKRSSLIAVSQGDVHVAEGLTQPMARLLQALEGGVPRSKESLVAEVWNYDYVPSRHDALLQATLGKLRKAMGALGDWIEWSGGSYRLRLGVRVLQAGARKVPAVVGQPSFVTGSEMPRPQPPTAAPVGEVDLNHRQLRALPWMRQTEFIDVRAYARRFRVCTMTACRDLGDLYRKGIVRRQGRARATRYALSS
jgi:hypothetical protein